MEDDELVKMFNLTLKMRETIFFLLIVVFILFNIQKYYSISRYVISIIIVFAPTDYTIFTYICKVL